MDIIKAYATKNLCYITSKPMTPKGIVVHSTGAKNPYLKRYVDCPSKLGTNTNNNHWNTATPDGKYVCVHAFIGYDKNNEVRIAEILPLNICCWGVGRGNKGSYNDAPAYIQFEICEDNLKNETYYRAAFDLAAEYCSYLCDLYGISINNIVGHCEAYKQGYGSNHSDPEHWMKNFGETMVDFRNKVSSKLNNTSNESHSISDTTTTKSFFENGDLVSISNDATYYSGKAIPSWVKSQNWYVKGTPSGDRVVIDKNEDGNKSICSPINAKYLKLVNSINSNTQENTKFPYLVKVTTPSLNIRKGPGTNTTKIGCITDEGVYTITEESVGPGATLWGKLKSKLGWISLDYTKKL